MATTNEQVPTQKKVPWQSTPEGRAKLSKMLKARAKAGKLWNQGKKGRARAQKVLKAAHKRRREQGVNIDNTTMGATRNASNSTGYTSKAKVNSLLSDPHVAFAFGFISSWIESHARSNGLPSGALAYRLGKLLLRSSRG